MIFPSVNIFHLFFISFLKIFIYLHIFQHFLSLSLPAKQKIFIVRSSHISEHIVYNKTSMLHCLSFTQNHWNFLLFFARFLFPLFFSLFCLDFQRMVIFFSPFSLSLPLFMMVVNFEYVLYNTNTLIFLVRKQSTPKTHTFNFFFSVVIVGE